MGLFRLVIIFLIGYMGYHFFKGFFGPSGKQSDNVKGRSKSQPLDLRDADVQDAKFKEIDEE